MSEPTPKQRVQALHPEANCKKKGDGYVVYSKKDGGDDDVIGHAFSSAEAWKDALSGLSLEEGTVEDDDKRIEQESQIAKEQRPSGDLWDGIPDELPPNHYEDVAKCMESEFLDEREGDILVDESAELDDDVIEQVPKKRQPARVYSGSYSQSTQHQARGTDARRKAKRKAARNARKVNRQKAKR